MEIKSYTNIDFFTLKHLFNISLFKLSERRIRLKLLNSKSILDCLSEHEEEEHRIECEQIIDQIYKLSNYKTALRFRFIDLAHKNKKEQIIGCRLHEFMENIDGIDCKNGYDFAYQENGIFTVIVFGQNYLFENKHYIIETHIDILPYNKNKEFVNILPDILMKSDEKDLN